MLSTKQNHDDQRLKELGRCLKSVLRVMAFEAACLYLIDSISQQGILLTYETAAGKSLPSAQANFNLPTLPTENLFIDNLEDEGSFDAFVEAGFQTALHTSIFHIDQQEQQLGSLFLLQRHAVSFTETTFELATTYSKQLGLILNRYQLLQEIQTTTRQANAITVINNALSSGLEMEHLLQVLLEQLTQVLEADVAAVSLTDGQELVKLKTIGREEILATLPAGERVPITNTALVARAVAQQAPVIIPNTLEHPDWLWMPGKMYIRSWIGIPIFADEHLEAIVTLHHTVPNFYQPEHLAYLSAFQDQAGLIIRTARLFSQTQKQAHDLLILNRLVRELAAATNIQEIGRQVTDCLHQNFHYSRAILYMATTNTDEVQLLSLSGRPTPPPTLLINANTPSIIGQVINNKETAEALYDHNGNRAGVHQLAHTKHIALPIKNDDELIAILSVEFTIQHSQLDTSSTTLNIICDQLAIALQKARFFEETTKHVDELKTLFALSAKLRVTKTKEDILPFVIEQCAQISQATGGSIMLVDASTDDLILQACYPQGSRSLGVRYQKENGGIVHHVAQTRKPYVALDVPNDPLSYMPPADRPAIITARSSISFPLLSEDQFIGVLNVWFDHPHIFTEGEINLLNALAEIAAGAIDRVSVHETLEQRVQERTQALEEANQQLKQLDTLKSRFISEVSHELRTPITNLSLYVNLFQRNKDRPEKQAKYLDVLNKQTERLEDLIETVLYLSRLDLGQDRFEFVPIDINEVIEEVLVAQMDHADSKGLVLTYEAKRYASPTSSWMGMSRALKVLGDRNQLAQLVTHLVDNALKYTDEGEVNVYLYLDKNQMVCIEVADSGNGIPTDEWDNIFKRFYRGERTSQLNIPGNGLGLAIAEEITKLHNGRIDLESKTNEGSKFFVWLPIIPY